MDGSGRSKHSFEKESARMGKGNIRRKEVKKPKQDKQTKEPKKAEKAARR